MTNTNRNNELLNNIQRKFSKSMSNKYNELLIKDSAQISSNYLF